MNQPARHRLRRVSPLIFVTLIAATLLNSCGWMTPPSDPTPTATHTRRDPTAADVESMRQQLAGIEGVIRVEMEYFKGTFGNGPSTNATLHTDATEKGQLVRILDTAYRLTWERPDIALGVLTYVVTNPAGLEVSGDEFGFPTVAGPNELQERYGPPGTPAPSPTR